MLHKMSSGYLALIIDDVDCKQSGCVFVKITAASGLGSLDVRVLAGVPTVSS